MKRERWIYLFLGVVLFTIACGLIKKMPSTPDATREAQSPPGVAQLTAAVAGNDAILATVSVKGTAQARELSIQLTKLSSELKVTPLGSEGVSWITSWLTHPACQPPCWENITPGVTTIDEAVKIVYQIPGVDITWLPSMTGATEGEKSLGWDFSQSGYGWIGTERWQEIVSEIHLGTGGEQLLLSGVNAAYGNPSSVVKGSCHGGFLSQPTCIYSIVYKDRGMELDIGIHDYKKVDIQADTETSTIYLYPLTGSRLNGSGIVWSGYGQYDFDEH